MFVALRMETRAGVVKWSNTGDCKSPLFRVRRFESYPLYQENKTSSLVLFSCRVYYFSHALLMVDRMYRIAKV